jgi:PPOX class F420-dependent enzyme/OxyR family protein
MSFTDEEIAYIRSQPLARLATIGPDEQPDVMPVALEYDGTNFWVGGPAAVVKTRKFRNLAAGRHKVAVVVDDHPSFDPFVARGSGSTASASSRSNASVWSDREHTCASRRRSRGVGTWPVSRSETPGIPPGRRSTQSGERRSAQARRSSQGYSTQKNKRLLESVAC